MKDKLVHAWRKFPILHSRLTAVIVFGLITAGVLCGFSMVQNSYVINDDGRTYPRSSFSDSVDEVLDSIEPPISEDDIVKIEYINDDVEGGWIEITITRAKEVEIDYDGKTYSSVAYTETPRELLLSLDIELSDADYISLDPDIAITEDCSIQIIKGVSSIVTEEISIPFGTRFVTSNAVADGSSTLVRKGSEGMEINYYSVIVRDNVEISRTLLCTEVTVEPIDEIIARGTVSPVRIMASDHNGSDLYITSANGDGSGTLQLYGEEYTYTGVLDIEATGYSCEGTDWRTTYTGTTARVGVVAVDPEFIPLGTHLIIVSDDGEYLYGYCIAEDTGGLIKDNVVDLYFDTDYECWQFGRRNCTAYIIAD